MQAQNIDIEKDTTKIPEDKVRCSWEELTGTEFVQRMQWVKRLKRAEELNKITQALSYLSGSLSYDNVARAKQELKTLLGRGK